MKDQNKAGEGASSSTNYNLCDQEARKKVVALQQAISEGLTSGDPVAFGFDTFRKRMLDGES